MSSAPAARAFEVRHLQLARAMFAAIAAAMVTFSPDHSAQVGLSVFSGFALATGLVLLIAAWLVYPAGQRWPAVLLGMVTALAGMCGGVAGLRSTTLFFVLVIAWAAVSGLIEVLVGARALRLARVRSDAPSPPSGSLSDRLHETRGTQRPKDHEARDTLAVGVLTLVLAIAVALVPSGFALQYYIEESGRSFTLTGVTIGVGIFGGYAAILAVYLAIAAFSPRTEAAVEKASSDGGAA